MACPHTQPNPFPFYFSFSFFFSFHFSSATGANPSPFVFFLFLYFPPHIEPHSPQPQEPTLHLLSSFFFPFSTFLHTFSHIAHTHTLLHLDHLYSFFFSLNSTTHSPHPCTSSPWSSHVISLNFTKNLQYLSLSS